jgi:hypothetical protein
MVVKGNGRFTNDEFEAYTRVKRLLTDRDATVQDEDERLADHMIVVFTGQDELEKKKSNIKDTIKDGSPELKQMLAEVGERYVTFDNITTSGKERKKQMTRLMAMIETVSPKHKKYFTSKLQQEVDKVLEQQVKDLMKRNGISEEKARQTLKLDGELKDGPAITIKVQGLCNFL